MPQCILIQIRGKQIISCLTTAVDTLHTGKIKLAFSFVLLVTFAALGFEQRFDVCFEKNVRGLTMCNRKLTMRKKKHGAADQLCDRNAEQHRKALLKAGGEQRGQQLAVIGYPFTLNAAGPLF
jgi:hypothetical protein